MERPDPSRAGGDPSRTNELGGRFRAGDERAFRGLFERVSPTLHAWIRLRLPGRGEGDLQDVAQEIWLRALQAFADYDPERSFRAWLLGIAKNVVLQWHQKRPREGRMPLLDGASGTPAEIQCADSATSVSLRAAENDALQRFLAYVDELKDEDRRLVLYCGLEEQPLAEAAARLGISTAAATKRWQSLRTHLRANGTLRALALEEG